MTNPDDYLQMSGIQHFSFCRRQWALAYMEQQWAENLRTAEGQRQQQFRAADDPGVSCRYAKRFIGVLLRVYSPASPLVRASSGHKTAGFFAPENLRNSCVQVMVLVVYCTKYTLSFCTL